MAEFIISLYCISLFFAEVIVWYPVTDAIKDGDSDYIFGSVFIGTLVGVILVPIAFVMGVQKLVEAFSL